MDRRAQILAGLQAIEARIAAACAAAGRSRDEVTLVAVTKTFPAVDVGHLAALGVRDIGENRDQEAAAKTAECARLGLAGLVWHFVGQLQTNKARSVTSYADVLHSVDRLRLVAALDKAADGHGRVVTCLVQVDLEEGRDAGRGGAGPAEVLDVAAAVAAADRLRLGGVMAIAPLGSEPEAAFARMAAVAAQVRAAHPDASMVSAGMSADLEAAVAAGATHLRVGTAILGSRPPLG